MTGGCEHGLVQRRVNERYWACVDCDLEFRPVESAMPTAQGVLFALRDLDTHLADAVLERAATHYRSA